MSEWQPIETAPRDGTAILLFYPEGRWIDPGEANDSDGQVQPDMIVARFDVEWGKRSGMDANCWEGYYNAFCGRGEPTHWMPLPDPPDAA